MIPTLRGSLDLYYIDSLLKTHAPSGAGSCGEVRQREAEFSSEKIMLEVGMCVDAGLSRDALARVE